ncbi:LysR family transcriptional regulator [Ponticoccus sp. SC2-23]|uniref:LysR family transcriptional regulator n=1 Tax=Alexandriicola marinus TaxID=2081710 RepID=UPI000FD763E4|nr:LysR family transcriptional regulator [Alexandriicola marinus]MBM1218661.1 LysR family transcriptional regulator [Ponticoccus sp. SC6-9]MBM1224267.1 LysR family transcriptional regulator [Ponticoccus sp. SC6-15]MBM1229954.1 LysR family transcriptional regulator [Ponticoccus sp. SC6-38]MBM1233233.1 LysR family transcriptional regulator [Ponticoccus sp. SC6-45]MBM1236817.1 LysR family transcriptional regulator [Ponticoccus sp. SC6-49]MBM1242244.1 LysR family transcriptional regulator [Pontic
MNITFRYLELLNAVVVSGSISKATRLTGLSQPTISQQLAKFEEELGAQLIFRKRGQNVELTPAGEHWFRASRDLLNRREEYETGHSQNFRTDQILLRFGATPSLRGRFTEAAASIAVDIGQFTRFEHIFALSSEEIVEMVDAHQLNCGVVTAANVEDHKASLSIRHLFHDRIVWGVPRSVSHEQVADALIHRKQKNTEDHALGRHVEVTTAVPWSHRSQAWYRDNLPGSAPFFHASTHQVAIDITAAGLATCHCPTSLLPNLTGQTLDRLRFYDLEMIGRDAVLIMPRHLTSLRPFLEFQNRLCSFVEQTINNAILPQTIEALPSQTRPMSCIEI